MTDAKTINIIITGTGGQGVITLLRILAEAAFIQGRDVKTSELHGLSQKGGTVTGHLRMGKKVFSPLVRKEDADLIIALEITEGLRATEFAYRSTRFVINEKYLAYDLGPEKEEVVEKIKDLPFNVELVPASRICKERLGKEVVAGVYLLSHIVCSGLIPIIKKDSLTRALEKIIPEKYLDINIKALESACHGKP